jgi:uncharacterized membrane protein YhaH (DUF805 family)
MRKSYWRREHREVLVLYIKLLPRAAESVAAGEALREWLRWLLRVVAVICVCFFCMMGTHDQLVNQIHPSTRLEFVANVFHYSTPFMAGLAALWGFALLVFTIVLVAQRAHADWMSGAQPQPREARQQRPAPTELGLMRSDWALLTLDALYLSSEHHSYTLIWVCAGLFGAYLGVSASYSFLGRQPN